MSISNQAAVTAAIAACMAAPGARCAEPGSLPGWAWFPVAAFAVFAVALIWARSPRA